MTWARSVSRLALTAAAAASFVALGGLPGRVMAQGAPDDVQPAMGATPSAASDEAPPPMDAQAPAAPPIAEPAPAPQPVADSPPPPPADAAPPAPPPTDILQTPSPASSDVPTTAAGADTPPPPAELPGQLGEGVAAIVNDEIISTYDLRQRMMLLIVTSGVQPTQENIPSLQREALRSLVDEHLQMQELIHQSKEQKFNLIADEKDIDSEIENLAKGNHMDMGQLSRTLAASGVDIKTLRDQMRVEISWEGWVRGRYGGSRLRVGEDQIKAVQERMNTEAGKPQYQIAEIFIDGAHAGGMAAAQTGAEQLVQQIQQGAPFAGVARQFSAAPTAAAGGDAGWMNASELAPEVVQALDQLRPGQLSKPITVSDGVYIIYLRDKRAGADATLVNLKQAAISLAPDATPDQVQAAQTKLLALKARIKGCDSMEAEAAKVDGVVAGDLGEAEIKDLAPDFQAAAKTLQPNQVSDPIRTSAGLHLVAVCEKKSSGPRVLSHDDIEDRLKSQQLSMISKRYMRDLRNSATIETR